jgi:hypothetical protein
MRHRVPVFIKPTAVLPVCVSERTENHCRGRKTSGVRSVHLSRTSSATLSFSDALVPTNISVNALSTHLLKDIVLVLVKHNNVMVIWLHADNVV